MAEISRIVAIADPLSLMAPWRWTRRQWCVGALATMAGASTNALADTPRRWPALVQQGEVSMQRDGERDGGSLFRSDHFEFWVESVPSVALMNDFARCAEATHRLWRELPLDVPPPSPGVGRAPVEIWRTAEGYARAGGPPNTSGSFRRGRGDSMGKLLVNAESLGLAEFNGTVTKAAGYRPKVLIHELSHQATADWLPFIPTWLSEGLAEYGAVLPYADGIFRLDADSLRTALRRHADYYRSSPDQGGVRRRESGIGGTGRLDRWLLPLHLLLDEGRVAADLASGRLVDSHRVYFTALLLTFHLLHFDPIPAGSSVRPLVSMLSDLTRCVRRVFRREADVSLPRKIEEAHRRFEIRSPRDVSALLLPDVWAGRSPQSVQAALVAAFARQGIALDFPPA